MFASDTIERHSRRCINQGAKVLRHHPSKLPRLQARRNISHQHYKSLLAVHCFFFFFAWDKQWSSYNIINHNHTIMINHVYSDIIRCSKHVQLIVARSYVWVLRCCTLPSLLPLIWLGLWLPWPSRGLQSCRSSADPWRSLWIGTSLPTSSNHSFYEHFPVAFPRLWMVSQKIFEARPRMAERPRRARRLPLAVAKRVGKDREDIDFFLKHHALTLGEFWNMLGRGFDSYAGPT